MIPHQMNCSHSGDGWCISCVGKLHAELEAVRACFAEASQDNVVASARIVELEEQLAKTEQARENWATVARERGEEIDVLIIAMGQRAEGGN